MPNGKILKFDAREAALMSLLWDATKGSKAYERFRKTNRWDAEKQVLYQIPERQTSQPVYTRTVNPIYDYTPAATKSWCGSQIKKLVKEKIKEMNIDWREYNANSELFVEPFGVVKNIIAEIDYIGRESALHNELMKQKGKTR